MLSYETHFASKRPDGRHICTMSAQMEMLRHVKPKYSLPDELTASSFAIWQSKLKQKLIELLAMPEMTEQPKPKKISSVQRDGYRVEKWELYPDDYSAVPFLALIPDEASERNPVPAVLCFLGSNHSKEFVADEEQINHPNCLVQRYPERNRMAKYIVQNGMAAFVFDNPGIGECSIMTAPEYGETQGETRVQLCFGYLHMGYNYVGISTFQKLCFLKDIDIFNFVDQDRIGICSHSLGTEPAISLGLISDKIKGIVFNDNLHEDLRRYVAETEAPDNHMTQNIGFWHTIPGIMGNFSFPEMCAAFAPRYLALTEGGADEYLNRVRRAYDVCGAQDKLQITHYPRFADPESRKFHGRVPDHGVSREEFYLKYCYCYPEDHSFRREPALKLLKQCFGI